MTIANSDTNPDAWRPDEHHGLLFVDATMRALPAYRSLTFSFVSVSHGTQHALLKASVRLSVEPPNGLRPPVQIGDIWAEQVKLPIEGPQLMEFLAALTSPDGWPRNQRTLRLLPENLSRFSTYFEPIDHGRPGGAAGDNLLLSGANTATVLGDRQSRILRDLESRAFESIDDLLTEYDCAHGQRDRSSLAVLLEPVCRFEADCSIKGEQAKISIRIPPCLSTSEFHVSVRNIDTDGTPLRLALNGDEFQWRDQGSYRVGDCAFGVPKAVICECRASFAGRVFDRIEVSDPNTPPNARRRLVELHDVGLKKLAAIFSRCEQGDRKALNQFEHAIALLFHMLGFDVAHLGAVRENSDGPDLYAWTASGVLLVIECTTGQFDEKKHQNFLARIQNAQHALATLPTACAKSRVVTVIITSNARGNCGSRLVAAEKAGALLLCADDIASAVERTEFTPDADAMLKRWANAATWRFMAAPSFD